MKRLPAVVVSCFFLAAVIPVIGVTHPADASEGALLLGNDALQLGRASSGVASPRSAYWSYMNPAAMVDLDRRLDINLYTIFPRVKLEPRGLLGNQMDGPLEWEDIFNVASVGMIQPLKSGTLGGGLFIPSGSSLEYPSSRNIVSRYLHGNKDRRLDYQHFRGVLAYAFPLGDGWSLGLGLHLSLSRFRSDHITSRAAPARYSNRWDHSYGAGLGVGLYKKWDRLAIGLNYLSRHWTESMKKYDDLLSSPLDTPQAAQAGLAYQLTPEVELTLDYKWLNWRKIGIYGSPIFDGGVNWRNQHCVKAGLEWRAHPRWTFMTGYSYSASPITEDNVFLASLAPAIIEHHVTGGLSRALSDKHQIHAVAVWALKNKMTDTGRGDLFSNLGKGTSITASAFSFMLGYSYLW